MMTRKKLSEHLWASDMAAIKVITITNLICLYSFILFYFLALPHKHTHTDNLSRSNILLGVTHITILILILT